MAPNNDPHTVIVSFCRHFLSLDDQFSSLKMTTDAEKLRSHMDSQHPHIFVDQLLRLQDKMREHPSPPSSISFKEGI